jgi:hypothetical protein
MNEMPERICEALEWLYGVEWELSYAPSGVHLIFKNKHGDLVEWMDGAADLQDANNDSGFGVPINDTLAHALAVTAPWEWMDCEPGEFFAQADVNGDILGYVSQHKTVADSWKVTTPDGVTHSGSAQSVDAAKTAARAAYLTWMRGRFAMKGCMA